MNILNKPTWCRSTSGEEEPPISAPAVDPLKDLQLISQLIARQVRLVRDGVASVLDMRPLTIGSPVLGLLVQSGDWLCVPRRLALPNERDHRFLEALFSTALTASTLIVLVTGN